VTETDSTIDLEAIRGRRAAAARGPWHWSGNTDTHQIRLSNWIPGSGRCTVMDFTRWGMQSARPRFIDADHFMVDANEHVVYEVAPAVNDRSDRRVYRGDIIDIRHPDAQLIAHAPQDIDDLLAEVDRLRAALAALPAAAAELSAEPVFVFSGRATGRDPEGYYHPRWDRAQAVSVTASTKAEATKKALAMLGLHPRHGRQGFGHHPTEPGWAILWDAVSQSAPAAGS
jgi:hypothetical protein